mgnify:CR=1 FL=1
MSDANKYGFGICPDNPQQNEREAWWCPTCKSALVWHQVTYQETHDSRYGGCGEAVQPIRTAVPTGIGELLCCPFCGGQPKEYNDGDGPMIGQAVKCVKCGARTEVNISKPRDGVRKWQTRRQAKDMSKTETDLKTTPASDPAPGSASPVIYTTECRRCKTVVPCSESEYHDAWEILCKPCYGQILAQGR